MASTAKRLRWIALMALVLGLFKGTLFLYQGLVELSYRGWPTVAILCTGAGIALLTALALWRTLHHFKIATLSAILLVMFGCCQASISVAVEKQPVTQSILWSVPIYTVVAIALYVHSLLVDEWH